MEEYKVAVTTKLNGPGVVERMVTVRADSVEEAEALYRQALARLEEWDAQIGANGSEARSEAPNDGGNSFEEPDALATHADCGQQPLVH